MRKAVRTFALLALIMTTVGCDRVTKHMATAALAGAPDRVYLAGMVRLEYAENAGAFLSLGAGLAEWIRVSLFIVGSGILLVATAALAWKHRVEGMPLLGLSVALAGGASNLFDRILRGSVIDFMSLGVGSLRTGIFNVADVAILFGGLLFLVGPFLSPLRRSSAES